MNDVIMCTKALVEAIKESSAYRDYEKAKAKLKDYPETMQQINDYRRKNFLLQTSREKIDFFTEISNFQKEYADFRKNPLVSEYTSAELGVCRMLQKINEDVMSAVDLEIDGFADMLGI